MKLTHRLMAYLKGELTVEETRQIEQEIAHDDKLTRLVEQLHDKAYVTAEVNRLRSYDTERGLRRLLATLAAHQQPAPAAPRRRAAIRWMPWLSAAAAVMLIVGAVVFWYRDYHRIAPLEIPQEVAQAIEVGKASGQMGAMAAPLLSSRGSEPIVSALRKAPMDDEVKEELLHATRVQTYINKEYWLTLPDGTLVHMASGTRIIYPEQFRGDNRDIYLEGEAYFMVAHSKGNRFIVHTAHGDVMEYGTEFDVDTRSTGGTSVVLVEGSISVRPAGGQEQMVRPGERAAFTTGPALISKTDVAPYRAWNTGKIEFADWPLERLMNVMAKWYGVTVDFAAPDMRTISVSGNFDRYDDLRPTIDALSNITGLQMQINGQHISINK